MSGQAPDVSSQTSQTLESDEVTCSSGKGRWLWAGIVVVAMVAVAFLAWRDLKRHCASGEDRLWGCIDVPPPIRVIIAKKEECRDDDDPYFTPID